MSAHKIAFAFLSIILALLNFNIYPSTYIFAQEGDGSSDNGENGDDNLNLCNFDHIKKFSGNGTLISSWGQKGNGDGEFLHPHGLAIDSVGNLYVTDEERLDVQKFDKNGRFLTKWGSEGSGKGQFTRRIEDINIDSSDNAYVVDVGNNRIQKFHSNGNFISMWGSK